jgi:hypothetical protein
MLQCLVSDLRPVSIHRMVRVIRGTLSDWTGALLGDVELLSVCGGAHVSRAVSQSALAEFEQEGP